MLVDMTASRRLIELMKEPLSGLGMKKRSQGIFTLDLGDDVLGWLGLNTASKGYRAGAVGVNVVVGVRHGRVEALVAELLGGAYHKYIPPTARTSLGLLMPDSTYVEFVFDFTDPAYEHSILELAELVEVYALPFMHSHVKLAELHRLLRHGYAADIDFPYRLIAVEILQGEIGSALQLMAHEVDQLDGRSDPAAEMGRRFVEAARSYLESRSAT
jgi:hypothetical protein